MDVSKRELPHVKVDIEKRLHNCRSELDSLGLSRADQNSQRLYLGKIASRFQAITQCALNGYYSGDNVFKSTQPSLKLATRMVELNEAFSNVFLKRAHQHDFGPKWFDEEESASMQKNADVPFKIPFGKYPELSDIITDEEYKCPEPSKTLIIQHIKEVFESSRGPEIGTASYSAHTFLRLLLICIVV